MRNSFYASNIKGERICALLVKEIVLWIMEIEFLAITIWAGFHFFSFVLSKCGVVWSLMSNLNNNIGTILVTSLRSVD